MRVNQCTGTARYITGLIQYNNYLADSQNLDILMAAFQLQLPNISVSQGLYLYNSKILKLLRQSTVRIGN